MADYTYTIFLDAGHGGSDPGAVYNGRREKDDTLALTLAIGDILESYGFNVKYARTEDIYESPYQKAAEGNASGSDIFISIHRNSSPYPNQYSGVESLVYNAWLPAGTIATNINRSWKRSDIKIWESMNAPIWWYSAKATFLPFWSRSASSITIRTMPCWIRNLTKQHGPLRTALQEHSGPGKSAPLRKQQAHPFGSVPAGINYGCTCRRTADGGTAGKYEAYSFLHKQRNNRYGDYT